MRAKPKYVGDSTITVSPGWQVARNARETASVAPTVIIKSSTFSAQPDSSERRAISRRSAGFPGSGSYSTLAGPSLRATADMIRASLRPGSRSALGRAAPSGTTLEPDTSDSNATNGSVLAQSVMRGARSGPLGSRVASASRART